MLAPELPGDGATPDRNWIIFALGVVLGALLATALPRARLLPSGAPPPDWASVCFTPPEDCTSRIEREIGAARQEVLVQAYGFTSRPIADALVAAHDRGVSVRVILDGAAAASEDAAIARQLARARIPVQVDDPSGIAHNKVMVLDRSSVITGSFNFTRSAEDRNAENLVVLRDPALAEAYAANWQRRSRVSVPLDQARPQVSKRRPSL